MIKIFNKRINRKSYILSLLFSIVLFPIIYTLISVILELTVFNKVTEFNFHGLLGFIVLLAWALYVFICVIRRLHDIGRSVWVASLFAIPTINIILVLFLLIPQSKKDTNEWGDHTNKIYILGLPYKSHDKTKMVNSALEEYEEVIEEGDFKDYALVFVKGLAIVVLVVIFLIQPLSLAKVYIIKPETIQKQKESLDFLEKNKEIYAKCYYSTSWPTSSITLTSMKYLIGATEEFKQKVKDAENSLINSINGKCTKPMNDYENAYTTLISSSNEINNKSRSLLATILRIQPSSAERVYIEISPQRTRLSQGFNNSYYTDEEIQSYFKEKLGY